MPKKVEPQGAQHRPPLVSIIVPCCNEVLFIGPFVDSLLAQVRRLGEACACEVLIADGASTDGTRAALSACAGPGSALRLLDNESRLTSTGLNACLEQARGAVIIRMDVHTTYAPDYLAQCLAVLAETGAANVGGPWVARGTTPMQRAIAAAFQSSWAMGGARSRDATYEGPVDSVYLGCWRREVFDAVGAFDETLGRNQDDEHNFRLAQQGFKVWQSPRIRSWYTPRSSLSALWRQWQQYGYWKVAVSAKHQRPTTLRQLVPAAFVLGMALLMLAGPLWPPAWRLALTLGALYGLTLVGLAVATAREAGWGLMPRLPAVFACYHLAYGTGFLRGLWDFLLWKRPPAAAMTRLSR